MKVTPRAATSAEHLAELLFDQSYLSERVAKRAELALRHYEQLPPPPEGRWILPQLRRRLQSETRRARALRRLACRVADGLIGSDRCGNVYCSTGNVCDRRPGHSGPCSGDLRAEARQ